MGDNKSAIITLEETACESNRAQIDLNVGGQFFSTSSQTLLMVQIRQWTFFKSVVGKRFLLHRPAERQVQYRTHFRHILNWLRDGGRNFRVPDLGLQPHEVKQLLTEVQFYQLLSMEKALQASASSESSETKKLNAAAVKLIGKSDRHTVVTLTALKKEGFAIDSVDSTKGNWQDIIFLSAQSPASGWKERVEALQNDYVRVYISVD